MAYYKYIYIKPFWGFSLMTRLYWVLHGQLVTALLQLLQPYCILSLAKASFKQPHMNFYRVYVVTSEYH